MGFFDRCIDCPKAQPAEQLDEQGLILLATAVAGAFGEAVLGLQGWLRRLPILLSFHGLPQTLHHGYCC